MCGVIKIVEYIDMWIDKDGDVFFDDYFDEKDAPKLKGFIEAELGYKVNLMRDSEREFKPEPKIWKKNVVRDIDWSNFNNILYIINHKENTDEDIVKGLHSEGSGFSITVKRGIILTEYTRLLETENGKPSPERLIQWAKEITNRFMKGKKLDVGTTVLVMDRGKKVKGKILEYDKGDYRIEKEDGFTGRYRRSEIELG